MSAPVAAIQAIEALTGASGTNGIATSATRGPASFAQMLLQGVNHVDQTQRGADAQVQAFALDDSVPVHQVMFALEEAQSSLQLMMQVRSRLVEGYQEFMRMQL